MTRGGGGELGNGATRAYALAGHDPSLSHSTHRYPYLETHQFSSRVIAGIGVTRVSGASVQPCYLGLLTIHRHYSCAPYRNSLPPNIDGWLARGHVALPFLATHCPVEGKVNWNSANAGAVSFVAVRAAPSQEGLSPHSQHLSCH